MSTNSRDLAVKVPAITLGETGGDSVSMSMAMDLGWFAIVTSTNVGTERAH